MTHDASGLRRFREPTTKPTKVWTPPTKFAPGNLLIIDQSLSATGWVWIKSSTGRLIDVLAAGSIMTKPDDWPSGYEGTLQRALYVAQNLDKVVRDHRSVDRVLHETPPMAVGRMARPESSLLASLGVRMACDRHGLPVEMVQNQHSKKVLLNAAREVTKKMWHAALDRYPIEGRNLVTNEGQRDALCLGLTWLIDEEEKR